MTHSKTKSETIQGFPVDRRGILGVRTSVIVAFILCILNSAGCGRNETVVGESNGMTIEEYTKLRDAENAKEDANSN